MMDAISSMYGRFTYIYHENQAFMSGKYTLHGWYGDHYSYCQLGKPGNNSKGPHSSASNQLSSAPLLKQLPFHIVS